MVFSLLPDALNEQLQALRDPAPSAVLWINKVMARVKFMIFNRAHEAANETFRPISRNDLVLTALNNQRRDVDLGSLFEGALSKPPNLLDGV